MCRQSTNNVDSGSTSFPLLPYSQLVWEMLKVQEDAYTFSAEVKIEKKLYSKGLVTNAVIAAIKNHPVFDFHIDNQGLQHYQPNKNPLHGQYYDFTIIEDSEYVYLHIKLNRILGDSTSLNILAEDLFVALTGKHLQTDYYIQYLAEREQLLLSDRYFANKQWLEEQFDDLQCPIRPLTDYPIVDNKEWAEGLIVEDYTDAISQLQHFSYFSLLDFSASFTLASALAIMEYNGTKQAALTWAYNGREKPEHQRIYGSLHRDIPFKISVDKPINKNSFEHLIKQARQQIRQGIAHSSYPYTLLKPHSKIWNYAVNVLQQPSFEQISDNLPQGVELIEQHDSDNKAYALLDIELYLWQSLVVVFRYSASHYKQSSIKRFADIVRKYINLLCDYKS